jgi:hypothetical protein
MQTEVFPVTGSAWKVIYTHDGPGRFEISVHDAQGNLIRRTINSSEPIKGVSNLKGPGNFYLLISGHVPSWKVTVKQYVSTIEEWNLRQLGQQRTPVLRKLGTWNGEDTDSTYQFTVPEGSWRIVYGNSGGGVFELGVNDGEGNSVLTAAVTEPGESAAWVHKAGPFSLHVKATGTAWKVEAFCK